jgi:hypothetical protein
LHSVENANANPSLAEEKSHEKMSTAAGTKHVWELRAVIDVNDRLKN